MLDPSKYSQPNVEGLAENNSSGDQIAQAHMLSDLYHCCQYVFLCTQFEPRHEKTCLWDLLPGKTQTDLLSYRDKLES